MKAIESDPGFSESRKYPSGESVRPKTDCAVKFDAMACVREHSGSTSLQVQYRNNLFSRDEMNRFVERWVHHLHRRTKAAFDPLRSGSILDTVVPSGKASAP